jgi:glycosyltransferase involved in cell wall biosynthesis
VDRDGREAPVSVARPLRIAYLLESAELFGGVKVVLQQAQGLAGRGHRVTVVSPGTPPDWFRLAGVRYERSPFAESRDLADADVRVATLWRTVAPALRGARGPVFHLCQGYEGEITWYRELWGEVEEAYRAPTRKLAVSTTLARRLESFGFGPVLDVGQTFDRREFTPGPERDSADPPVVLVVGPVEIDFKGIDVVLDGLSRYRRRGGRFRVRRVSYFPAGEAERRFGITDEYHHRLPPERMPFAYRCADAFVAGSRPAEGFGLPTLEALACGVPVLTSDTPGQREIGGDAAAYFADGDPDALAAAMPDLLTARARIAAREKGPAAAARYDTAKVAGRLEDAFREALA